MNGVSRKPARTVAELARTRQHPEKKQPAIMVHNHGARGGGHVLRGEVLPTRQQSHPPMALADLFAAPRESVPP